MPDGPRQNATTDEGEAPARVVRLAALDEDSLKLWRSIGALANELAEVPNWCLVGGLMVQSFAADSGLVTRPTSDIDLLGDARKRPPRTKLLSEKLRDLGGELAPPDQFDRAFEFTLPDGSLVDVLAPDGLSEGLATTLSGLKTIQIPGGSQALSPERSERVTVLLDDVGETFELRRPTLTGALLIKARALPVHENPEDQRRDVITLLSLVEDARAMREEMSAKERGWLRKIEARLNLDDPLLANLFADDALENARAALRLLVS
jgi:hypothetical protein